MKQYWQIK
jgi:DNA mismatch repair protein MSH6